MLMKEKEATLKDKISILEDLQQENKSLRIQLNDFQQEIKTYDEMMRIYAFWMWKYYHHNLDLWRYLTTNQDLLLKNGRLVLIGKYCVDVF